jgi:two-component system OmpR family response regulator
MGNKVLVIDDDASICELICLALESKGLKVKTAQTGGEGIKAVGEFGPDVILLDHRLPDMDGIETARRIKATAPGKNASIVLMSGDPASDLDIEPGLIMGHLMKPFKLSEMAEYIKKIMIK